MIVGSILLILVAVGLLVGGVVDGSNPLIVGSMATTIIAAVALVVGVRQSAAAEDADTPAADNSPTEVFPSPFRETGRRTAFDRFRRGGAGRSDDAAPAGAESAVHRGQIPTQAAPVGAAAGDRTGIGDMEADTDVASGATSPEARAASTEPIDEQGVDGVNDEDDVPPDEPGVETVSLDDADRIASMTREVFVIDGRPRYHLANCVHLFGRESEPLPVAEAIELGFTPCALCEPDLNLLEEASPA